MTSEDAACGFIGFLVVFALRKATAPEALNATPTTARTKAMAMRTEGSSAAGARRAIPHMASATSRATTGGGIFSSREDIATFLLGVVSTGACVHRLHAPSGSKFHRSGAPEA